VAREEDSNGTTSNLIRLSLQNTEYRLTKDIENRHRYIKNIRAHLEEIKIVSKVASTDLESKFE
jgi:hypothetical protein